MDSDARYDGTIFSAFAPSVAPPSPLRRAITNAYRRAEPDCVTTLLPQASLEPAQRAAVAATARTLIKALRAKRRGSGVEELVQEYALSSQEGVALMCLAEALLRIPDAPTRDALIRDKISDGDWISHLSGKRSLFVNAATWGLVVTGKLTGSVNETGLTAALTRVIARFGEPVIRQGVNLAIRMMGEQFVTGETIEEALARAQPTEARGFTHSYDMLGEAAVTAADADRFHRAYESAIHAIGRSATGRGIYHGPGISIKLSALHPRYARAQVQRVMQELLPRLKKLARIARHYNIGLNIDAEEADRLELSLDLLENLARDRDLAGWDGLGFVVQAYGKRCPFVIDFIIDLARRSQRRIMVRLVKGAYWDAEIKRAQVDGLEDFPVFTRKVHTDISYIACARKLLAARDAVFPQFATHNAQTLATIYHLAGDQFEIGDYEFQCLHGMGEPLYDEVVSLGNLNRPCRIYAPVGTHETLLAYLVRRLLENGANSSFVNRIADPAVAIDELIADPAMQVKDSQKPGMPHERIALPAAIYPDRQNSAGLDLSNEDTLIALSATLQESARTVWHASPLIAAEIKTGLSVRTVQNPGNHADQVGTVVEADDAAIAMALDAAAQAQDGWQRTPVAQRALMLNKAADQMQEKLALWLGLIMREAGKSAPNAIAEVREAIDFLRYYAREAERIFANDAAPVGPVICISPWNFPMAIFIGQIAAALVAGNPVIAKPAEETPLIAAAAVTLLHDCGVPRAALQFLPGDGRVGAALVASPLIGGVMFTGSTDVARLINRQLAARLTPQGNPVALIAETGGQNAMIVDSSALSEQVVADVISSAFDSAGQRCSALRLLCLQEDIAGRVLTMLKGALHELSVGCTNRLSVDIGPVITAEAKANIENHIERMRGLGCAIEQIGESSAFAHGTFVPPTIIEIDHISQLDREIFGPVLHVLRYQRDTLDAVIDAINATGYALTFGLHTRIDETVEHVSGRISAGNIYINRNIIGAVVGVQPFGGHALSGTGPKAGGPLYLPRLVRNRSMQPVAAGGAPQDKAASAFVHWLNTHAHQEIATEMTNATAMAPQYLSDILPGPVGEKNIYRLQPKGRILLAAETVPSLLRQVAAVLATGNDAHIYAPSLKAAVHQWPDAVRQRCTMIETMEAAMACQLALIDASPAALQTLSRALAQIDGPIIPVLTPEQLGDGLLPWRLESLMEEVSLSVNTTAAGGNASLMALN